MPRQLHQLQRQSRLQAPMLPLLQTTWLQQLQRPKVCRPVPTCEHRGRSCLLQLLTVDSAMYGTTGMSIADAPLPDDCCIEGLHVQFNTLLSTLACLLQVMMRQVLLHRSKPQQRGPLTAQPPSMQPKVRCPVFTKGLPGYSPDTSL